MTGNPRRALAELLLPLAQRHRDTITADGPPPDLELAELGRRLENIYHCLSKNAEAGRPGTRVEEWLLDNRHIVQEAFEQVRASLPQTYLKRLPQVRGEDGAAVLRVFALAQELLRIGAKPVDAAWLESAVALYQSQAVLTIGELWALPSLLRLAVLRELATDACLCLGIGAPGAPDAAAQEPLAAEVAGAVVSLRQFAACDWRRFFETLSHVEQVLRRDPDGAYPQMDFASRNRYRSAVEELARGCDRSELEIAERVLERCQRAGPGDHRNRHAGFYLISDGRAGFERELGFRPQGRRRLLRVALNHPSFIYFGLLAALALPPLVALGVFLSARGLPVPAMAVVVLLTALPVTGLAVALLNGLVTWLLPPRLLPKLNFERGIPPEFRCAVVTPVLLASPEDVDHVLGRIEINYLGNPDPQLVYAVLSDFSDAAERSLPGDAALLQRAETGIHALNHRHGTGPDAGPFLFLHRERQWNAAENCWMGWERKRGKLVEFNRLLAGGTTAFATCIGRREGLDNVRYVITLDADTQLPPGAAQRLVGALAHPLNRAVMDPGRGCLTAGYSILQPRVDIDPTGTADTRFAAIFAGDTTLDLYSRAASDVYHDLFGEGIYAGKGIYDWRAFEHSLHTRIPDNALLSHDLLEGVHARVALASDIRLLEQYPANAPTYMRRLHRWIRGDWQLLPWLRPLVPSTEGGWQLNPLPYIHQWKIFDNLRRSLQPSAVLALLCIGWSGLLPGAAWAWTLLFAGLLAAPLISEVLGVAGPGLARPRTLPPRLRRAPAALRAHLEHWLLTLVLLPHESLVATDAVVRTLLRMFVTHRRLLEWTSAAHVQRRLGAGLRAGQLWRELWFPPLLALTLAGAIAVLDPFVLAAAGPLLLAWLLAPPIVAWTCRPLHPPVPPLDEPELEQLRSLARRTWLFFEQFVGPDDHWLPPDNFQEEPRQVLARRTSPTNIGMSLLATLAAHDFGYLDSAALTARLRNSLERMGGLVRYRGHWLNWYETRELKPLLPRYVSTVDSGNLAASLLVLARGIEEIAASAPDIARLSAGVQDALSVLEEILQPASPSPALQQLRRALTRLRRAATPAADPLQSWQWIDELYERALPDLQDEVLELIEGGELMLGAEELGRLRAWLGELQRQTAGSRRCLDELLPWRRWLADPPPLYQHPLSDAALPTLFRQLEHELSGDIPLAAQGERCRAALEQLRVIEQRLDESGAAADLHEQAQGWNRGLRAALERAGAAAAEQAEELRDLANLCDRYVDEMKFGFLYDESRHIFRIGYNVTAGAPDPNHYDLLASEARLSGFVAIAKGDVPIRHWLTLSRPFRRLGRLTVLMSWGATLFEYLMPRLFMATPKDSLLDRASRSAIQVHRNFTARRRLPWGLAESGYYQLDSHLHYQYRAFGAPGIGFRRDLGDRLVIAPYASMMALAFDAPGVLANLRQLRELNMIGPYGLYEAVDFGRIEKAAPRRARIVRSYMSHHQGMAFLALDNYLNGDIMLRRFHADPRIAGIAMLLHERPPGAEPVLTAWERPLTARHFRAESGLESWSVPVRGPAPQINLLSNGHYSLTLTDTGSGGSQWEDVALTRWHCDMTRDEGGHWFYVRDEDAGRVLSLGLDPVGGHPEHCSVQFGPHLAEYRRREHGLLCTMQIALSSQHDIEVRKLTIRNESERPRRLLVAACAEVALAPPQEFQRHPAFARLFIESELLADDETLLFRRRPRSGGERPLYLAHGVLVSPGVEYRLAWETDRMRFLGRGGRAAQPQALKRGLKGFSGSAGAVLDPVMASGIELRLAPREEIEIAWLTGAGRSRRELLDALQSYRSLPRVNWIFEQARMQTRQELHNLEIAPQDLRGMTELLSAVLAPRPELRAADALRACDTPIQPVLWSRGISGDWPILLVDLRSAQDIAFVEPLLKAHTFWCGRQQAIDLVIIDEESAGYAQPARDRLQQLIAATRARTHRKLCGSVFVVAGKELQTAERNALLAAARVVLDPARGTLSAQLRARARDGGTLPAFVPVTAGTAATQWNPPLPRPAGLLFDNGLGGFTPDGREYVLHLEPGQLPPAPWSNVIANPDFGCLLSEGGSACTWAGNSSELRLTPWANDPVGDRGGEVLYLRDEETGRVWTPTPLPRPDEGAYQVRHGAGYSDYLHHSQGLRQHYRVFVDRDAPVKLCRLTLHNEWPWTRRITATYYCEWVLGGHRAESAPFLCCEFDAGASALLARNAFSRLTGSATAFLTASRPPHGMTADRGEFLGRGGDPQAPAALFRVGLSGTLQTGADPCGAYQVHLDLPAGATQTLYFVIGQGRDRGEALALAQRFRSFEQGEASWERVLRHWNEFLGAVQVDTPEPAMNLLLNRWLPYQALACRLWGRSGYYQSSGAFGFRDQLQDVMALTWAAPERARAQILRAAGRQFQDGDVLHWWHEAPLRGVRTRCSDDLLWLPYVTAHYLRCTGDNSILHEPAPYLAGVALERDETDHYAEFTPANEDGSLYEHCCRAIERAAAVGSHGLPAIGSGDWNDGMNRVSTTGRGESVWLAWFLVRVCADFAPVCEALGDTELAAGYRRLAGDLRARIEDAAWDGDWYRRAYYDDGSPLGSADNDECRIDLIAQAWSVLAVDAPAPRARQAMQSAWDELVREDERLVLLLAPPFDRSTQDPGYIKGYPPGIRENGGQYTHAATWAVWAMAGLDDGERAMQLFRLLNPILRSASPEAVARYRVEPYVLAGDIYGVAPHAGRGGWTWYTGAAGWLYRAGLEALLGLQRRGDALEINPCLPAEWKKYQVRLRRGRASYLVTIENPHGVGRGEATISYDGRAVAGNRVPFVDDGQTHAVHVYLLPAPPQAAAAAVQKPVSAGG